MHYSTLIRLILIGMLTIPMFLNAGCYCVQLQSGEAGVEKVWGKVSEDNILTEGGLKISLSPGAQMITLLSRTKRLEMIDSDGPDDRDMINAANVSILTEENLKVPIDVTILYSLKPEYAAKMYIQYGEDIMWDNKLVVPKVRSVVRAVIGRTNIYGLNQERSVYEQEIVATLMKDLESYGINIENVLIRDIGLPPQIEEAVLKKMQAQEEAEQAKYELEKTKQKVQIEIERNRGIAEANRLLTQSLDEKVLSYKQLELQQQMIEVMSNKWNGQLPQYMGGGDNGLLMMLDTK